MDTYAAHGRIISDEDGLRTSVIGTHGTSRAREYSPGRINGQDVIVAQAIIWPEVQQNQAS